MRNLARNDANDMEMANEAVEKVVEGSPQDNFRDRKTIPDR